LFWLLVGWKNKIPAPWSFATPFRKKGGANVPSDCGLTVVALVTTAVARQASWNNIGYSTHLKRLSPSLALQAMSEYYIYIMLIR